MRAVGAMFLKHLSELGGDRRGAVSVIFAMALVVILGAAGLAIDYARCERTKSEMQLALDAAVLAGAVAVKGEETSTAQRRFSASDIDGVKATFSVTGTGEVTGQARAHIKNSLLQVLGLRQTHVAVSSTAVRNSSSRVCILVLNPVAAQALLVNGGANVTAPDCEIDVHSTGNPAAVFNAGTALNVARTCIAGGSILDNGGAHPGLEVSCVAASDPFAGTLPDPASATCDFTSLNFNGGTAALTPGVYCGGINFNAAPDITLAPGVYVIKGGNWNVNGGTWTGNGVVFYFADSSIIQFNSAVNAVLSPPASGPYEGVAMFEAGGLAQSPFVLDDSKGFKIEGLIYLPSRNATFNSGSALSNKKFTLVVNTLILDQTAWDLEPGDLSFSSAAASGTSRLTQ